MPENVIKAAAELVQTVTAPPAVIVVVPDKTIEQIISAAAELVQTVTKPPPVVVVVPDKTIENVIESAAELVQQLTKVPSKSPSERLKDWLDSMYNSEDRSTLYVNYTNADSKLVTSEYNANSGYKINGATDFTKWTPATSIPVKG